MCWSESSSRVDLRKCNCAGAACTNRSVCVYRRATDLHSSKYNCASGAWSIDLLVIFVYFVHAVISFISFTYI